ncbi:MAG: hypothetical protein WBA57_25075 [Elainellaceae cyanobacterium]
MSLPGHTTPLPELAVSAKATLLSSTHQSEQVYPALLAQRSLSLPDGTYLYGQVPERDQLGAAYLVFEVVAERVTGAFYMPHSSFDCFQGSFENNQLALQIRNSYEQTVYPFSIAMQDVAIANPLSGGIPAVALDGFYEIESIDSNDQRVLETCQADLSQSI